MKLTRRGWIGASAGLAGLSLAGGASAQGAPRPRFSPRALAPASVEVRSRGSGGADYAAAIDRLVDYARLELATEGLPGMTIALADGDGFMAVVGVGYSDVQKGALVGSGHYFQIGSISKSFIALAVLALSDAGKIEIDAPAGRYLPELLLPQTPITVAQLLSHAAGLPDGAPLYPRTPDGRLWSGFEPGSRFSYSNTGFVLLGRIIEHVTGLPHQIAVDRLVRDKLELSGMAGVISQDRREAFAVGYWPANRTAAAALPGAPLMVATWDEEDTPAGSIGATSAQMAVYLRALIQLGSGKGAPVLSDAAAKRFTSPVVPAPAFGPGAYYACGIAVAPVDGKPCLHHTGGMMAFSSSFHVDPAAGVGAFASVNGRLEGYRPRQTTAFAVRLMRAVKAHAPLPTAPDPAVPHRVADPAAIAGQYHSKDQTVDLVALRGGLVLQSAGQTGAVGPQGPTRLVTDHPQFAAYGLDLVRETRGVIGFWWGETLFGRGAPLPQPAPAEGLRPLAGRYLNRDPWVGGAAVLVRGDTLVVDGVGVLADRGGWWTAAQDHGGIERLRFDGLLNGRCERMNVSGDDLIRITI